MGGSICKKRASALPGKGAFEDWWRARSADVWESRKRPMGQEPTYWLKMEGRGNFPRIPEPFDAHSPTYLRAASKVSCAAVFFCARGVFSVRFVCHLYG